MKLKIAKNRKGEEKINERKKEEEKRKEKMEKIDYISPELET